MNPSMSAMPPASRTEMPLYPGTAGYFSENTRVR